MLRTHKCHAENNIDRKTTIRFTRKTNSAVPLILYGQSARSHHSYAYFLASSMSKSSSRAQYGSDVMVRTYTITEPSTQSSVMMKTKNKKKKSFNRLCVFVKNTRTQSQRKSVSFRWINASQNYFFFFLKKEKLNEHILQCGRSHRIKVISIIVKWWMWGAGAKAPTKRIMNQNHRHNDSDGEGQMKSTHSHTHCHLFLNSSDW